MKFSVFGLRRGRAKNNNNNDALTHAPRTTKTEPVRRQCGMPCGLRRRVRVREFFFFSPFRILFIFQPAKIGRRAQPVVVVDRRLRRRRLRRRGTAADRSCKHTARRSVEVDAASSLVALVYVISREPPHRSTAFRFLRVTRSRFHSPDDRNAPPVRAAVPGPARRDNMEGLKDQAMNLLNGTEVLSTDMIKQVFTDLQHVLPSLNHLKVVSVRC